MSSWLDRKYLESLAKSALAEAQKTLDKALDIKDDEDEAKSDPVQTTSVAPPPQRTITDVPLKSGTGGLVKSFSNNLGVGGWGSFTGSFFEATELGKEDEETSKKPRNKRRQKSAEVSEQGKITQESIQKLLIIFRLRSIFYQVSQKVLL